MPGFDLTSGRISQLADYVGKPDGSNLFTRYTSSFYLVTYEGKGRVENATSLTEDVRSAIIPIQHGKTYNIIATGNSRFRLAADFVNFISTPFSTPVAMIVDDNAAHSYTYVNTSNYNFLYIYVGADGAWPVLTVTSPDADPPVERDIVEAKTLFGRFDGFYKSATCANVSVGQAFDLGASNITAMYTAWDALVTAYPTKVTKSLLGYGSKADGSADNTLPIYEYLIMPNNTPKCPKILISSGIHGNEKGAVWACLQFFTQMLAGWRTNELLMALRNNAIYKVVPICNPGGYNADTRNNLRNINLNRNFGYLWSANTDADKGSAAYSELESQAYAAWLGKNKNATTVIDLHETYQENREAYINTANPIIQTLYSSIMRTLSWVWKTDYPTHTVDIGYFGDSRILPATMNEAYYIYGFKLSALLESAKFDNTVAYTAGCIERNVDIIANYLLGIMSYLNTNGAS